MRPRTWPVWAKSAAPTSERRNRHNLRDSRHRDAARGGVGADAVALRALEDLVNHVADRREPSVEDLARPVLLLEPASVQDATRVDHEIRRVGDTSLSQQVG